MAMLSREKILESLLDLSGRGAARSRPELLGTVLRCAIALTESEGSIAVVSPGRAAERYTLGRSQGEPDVATLSRTVAEGARLLLVAGKPVLLADVASDGRVAGDDRFPGIEAGPALYVPLRLRDQSPGYISVFRRCHAGPFEAEDARLLTLLAA